MTDRLLTGSCLCRAIRYEVPDAFVYAAYCHCSKCRRTTGAANKPFAGIEREKFRPVAEATDLLVHGDPAGTHDLHCRHCGSIVYSVVRENLWVHVAMGTLADTPSIRPDHHIMVGSKAAWEEIADGLPQYAEFADGPRIDA